MHVKLMRQPLIAGMIACFATSLSVMAQSTSSPYEPEFNTIVMESSVDLANFKVPASLAPALAGLSSIILTGAVELRTRLDSYDPIGRTARITLFLAVPSSAKPTANLPAVTESTLVAQFVIRVESINHMKGTPLAPGLLAVGMTGRYVNTLGGSLPVPNGTPFLLSFSYPADAVSASGNSSATFGEFSFLIPGILNSYSPAPVGSITVTPPASN